MSTPNIQLMEQLGVSRKLRRVAKIIYDDTHAENVFSVVLLPLCNSMLPIHYFLQLFRIVRAKEALFLFGVYLQLFFDVLFDRVPDMIKVDAWPPDVDSFKGIAIHVQN